MNRYVIELIVLLIIATVGSYLIGIKMIFTTNKILKIEGCIFCLVGGICLTILVIILFGLLRI